jgi:tetrapyrrole methylase family protein/MazG family protein
MASEITIVGLGPGPASGITLEARRAIDSAPLLFLRTSQHPAAQEIAAGRSCHSFDDAYAAHATFDEVYQEIVDRLIESARRGTNVVYGVPGDPMVGEATTPALRAAAGGLGIAVRIVHAPSFIEPCLELVERDALDGLQVADGMAIARGHFPALSPDRPALVGQVFSRLVASEVKLTLLAQYPPDHVVLVLEAAGSPQARADSLPLSELDRLDRFSHTTSVFVPALPRPSSFESLQETIAHLRAPDGCPWDREQTHESLRPHLLEETYETLEAIDSGDAAALKEELGDLLLQIVLQAQISSEEGDFGMAEVIAHISDKLVRRHPHVFGDLVVTDVDEVLHNWEGLKEEERKRAGAGRGALDGVPDALPALAQALEIQSRAARLGFDWRSVDGVRTKLDEELAELQGATDALDREAEVGDLLFAAVNYARWIGVDPEAALRGSNRRFRRRFSHMEVAASGAERSLREMTAEELDALWEQAKHKEDKA